MLYFIVQTESVRIVNGSDASGTLLVPEGNATLVCETMVLGYTPNIKWSIQTPASVTQTCETTNLGDLKCVSILEFNMTQDENATVLDCYLVDKEDRIYSLNDSRTLKILYSIGNCMFWNFYPLLYLVQSD